MDKWHTGHWVGGAAPQGRDQSLSGFKQVSGNTGRPRAFTSRKCCILHQSSWILLLMVPLLILPEIFIQLRTGELLNSFYTNILFFFLSVNKLKLTFPTSVIIFLILIVIFLSEYLLMIKGNYKKLSVLMQRTHQIIIQYFCVWYKYFYLLFLNIFLLESYYFTCLKKYVFSI